MNRRKCGRASEYARMGNETDAEKEKSYVHVQTINIKKREKRRKYKNPPLYVYVMAFGSHVNMW